MSTIVVRKVKFEFPDELDDVLPGDDPVRETYLAAFSLTMPYLEPYLIRTYRAVADEITDPELAADVREFIGQEAQHFQNHRRINEIIKASSGPTPQRSCRRSRIDLDADYRRFNAEKSRRFNLMYAEGFEAMTCAMAMDHVRGGRVGCSRRLGSLRGVATAVGVARRRGDRTPHRGVRRVRAPRGQLSLPGRTAR